MAEAITFDADLTVLRDRMRTSAAFILAAIAMTLLGRFGSDHFNGRSLAKAQLLYVLGPVFGIAFGLLALSLRLKLARNRPVLTILPEGIQVPRWGFIAWTEIRTFDVAWSKGPRLVLTVVVRDPKAIADRLPWTKRLLHAARDWSFPLTIPQSDVGTLLPEVLTVLEAHGPPDPPKAPAP